jgi:hypothetical protein
MFASVCGMIAAWEGANMSTKEIPTENSVQEISTSDEQRPEQPTTKVPKTPLSDLFRRFLEKHPKARIVGWCIALLIFLLVIPVAYATWLWLGSPLWEWAKEEWWHFIPAYFAAIFLIGIPAIVLMGGVGIATYLAEVSLSSEGADIRKAQQTVRETEEDAINRLEQTDSAGLLPLLKYSRAQLQEYYAIGLKQTRRSFLHSVLAMWLGFILLLVGVALYIGPVEKMGLAKPDKDAFNVLVIGGAVIIEFISALFLWAFRSSTVQLNRFYDRQMHTHAVVMCYRIASTIAQADDTKKAIIEKILDRDWTLQIPAPVGAEGLRKFIPTHEAKTT